MSFHPYLTVNITPHSIPPTVQLHEADVSNPSTYSYDAMQLSEADVSNLSIHNYDATPSCETWLAQWTKHLAGLSESVMVPSAAATVTTPLNIN